ncbi:hypothetical protein IGI04_024552, partial [Brassica rapa subsp. trilocularis]
KYLSASPVPQTGVPGIRHSTFESLRVGRSSQSIASNLLAYFSSLMKRFRNSWVYSRRTC